MKVICGILLIALVVSGSLGCCFKGCGCGCGCGGLGQGLSPYQNSYGYGVNPYAGYNPYGSFGAQGCCDPVTSCLMRKLKPCLLAKELLMKKMYKKNCIANKLYCSW